MEDIKRSVIWFIEKSFQGAWVIHGKIGTRQYIGYSKAEAVQKYKDFYKAEKERSII